MKYYDILLYLEKIDSEEHDLIVLQEAMNSYEKAYLILEQYRDDNERDFTSFSLFQESDDGNNQSIGSKLYEMLKKIWEAILQLFGITKKKTEELVSEKNEKEVQKSANTMEEIKLKDPELNKMISDTMVMMSDPQISNEQLFQQFFDFSKSRDKSKMKANLSGKLLATAAVIGGGYMAHKYELDKKAVNYVKGKVDEKIDSVKTDLVNKMKGTVSDFGNNLKGEINEKINDVTASIEKVSKETKQEIIDIKSDIKTISEKLSAVAKKFVNSVFQSFEQFSGMTPPTINIDEIIKDVYYDENGKLHIPVDFNLIEQHIKNFLSSSNFSREEMDRKIKSNQTDGVTIEDYSKYYAIICDEILNNANIEEYYIDFNNDEVYQEASSKNKDNKKEKKSESKEETKEEAKRKLCIKYTNVLAKQIKQNSGVDISNEEKREIYTKFMSQESLPETFSDAASAALGADYVRNLISSHGGDLSNRKEVPERVNKNEIEKAEDSSEDSDYKSKTVQALQSAGKTVSGLTRSAAQKASSSENELVRTIGQAATKGIKKIEEIQKKIELNLDFSAFATGYRAYIYEFYENFTKSYKTDDPSKTIDFEYDLKQYVILRGNILSNINRINTVIDGDKSANQVGILGVINTLISKNATMKGSLLNDNCCNILNNISKYLQWDLKFFGSINDLFSEIDEYIKSIENVGVQFDSILNEFDKASSKPTANTKTESQQENIS